MWEPLGLVDCRIGEAAWRTSHAFVPTPYKLSEEAIRIYVAFLDDAKVGRVGARSSPFRARRCWTSGLQAASTTMA
jgi:hypothetical protein